MTSPFFRALRVCFTHLIPATFALCLLTRSESVAQDTTVIAYWGVRPFTDGYNPPRYWNGTTLCTADGPEWGVNAFNARYELGLLWVGDGTLDETRGFKTARWLIRRKAYTANAANNPVGLFQAGATGRADGLELAMDAFGSPEDLDPEDEFYGDWEAFWQSQVFALAVREKATGRMWRLSETPGGIDPAGLVPYTADLIEDSSSIVPGMYFGEYNILYAFLMTDSKKAYFGAELPAVCAWQADGGIEASELDGFGAEALALAAALGRKPAETASVELAVDEVVPAAGGATLRFRFDAVAPNGTKTAVSNLQYGATLVLERAETLADLLAGRTVREAIDPSSGVAVLPAGASGFARLHLSLP